MNINHTLSIVAVSVAGFALVVMAATGNVFWGMTGIIYLLSNIAGSLATIAANSETSEGSE